MEKQTQTEKMKETEETRAESAEVLLSCTDTIRNELGKMAVLVELLRLLCITKEEKDAREDLYSSIREALLQEKRLRTAVISSIQEDGQGLNAMQSQPAPNAPIEHRSE